ncbi:hypothetical protein BJ166DRAFT_594573 [Pestalotiopsis sp. NC0098]|nr:hypothetical protein BJ166DRAFT_594573 [Pestalotiopsis sp. NC0098]
MSKLIVVIGVTGTQGSSVANTFLELPGWRVRGTTRNPQTESARAMAARGVDVVQADYNDAATLPAALEGAHVVFCNTDFFVNMMSAQPDALPAGVRSVNEQAYRLEVAQNVAVAEAAARAAPHLERFVLSSLSHASRWSRGEITSLWHYDSKAEALRIIGERFPDLAAKVSTVQIGHYVENMHAFPGMMPQRQADGSYAVLRPLGPDVPIPFVVAGKDTGAFVKALVDAPAGTDLLGASEVMSWEQWAAVWGRVNGVQAGFRRVENEELFRGAPKPLADELWDAHAYFEKFGHTGGDPDVVTPEQLGITKSLTTMEEYIRGEDWSSALKA